MQAESIEASFAPRRRNEIASVELDGETVLVVEGSRSVHWLDQLATIVWDAFDGSATIDELAEAFAEAFDADVDVVRTDILALARRVGGAGLLQGVAETPPQRMEYAPPTGLPIGDVIPPFRLTDIDGRVIGSEDFLGRTMLLVNWSPHCGYCRRIAPDLAEIQADLARQGRASPAASVPNRSDSITIVKSLNVLRSPSRTRGNAIPGIPPKALR